MIFVSNGPLVFQNVRFLRQKYGVSRRALAKLVGLSPIKLRDLEEGLIPQEITGDTLDRLCQVFHVSVEKLVHTDLSLDAA